MVHLLHRLRLLPASEVEVERGDSVSADWDGEWLKNPTRPRSDGDFSCPAFDGLLQGGDGIPVHTGRCKYLKHIYCLFCLQGHEKVCTPPEFLCNDNILNIFIKIGNLNNK